LTRGKCSRARANHDEARRGERHADCFCYFDGVPSQRSGQIVARRICLSAWSPVASRNAGAEDALREPEAERAENNQQTAFRCRGHPVWGVGTESTSMANPNRRGPRALAEIPGELFTVRGYGRLRALSELEEVWKSAVGEPHCHQTRLGEVRRGVLNVTVAHPTLLEELAAFRKPALLQALRIGVPGTTIRDIRFRVGPIVEALPAKAELLPPPNLGNLPPKRSRSSSRATSKERDARGRSDDRDRIVGED
jgi:hypothetical protein